MSATTAIFSTDSDTTGTACAPIGLDPLRNPRNAPEFMGARGRFRGKRCRGILEELTAIIDRCRIDFPAVEVYLVSVKVGKYFTPAKRTAKGQAERRVICANLYS